MKEIFIKSFTNSYNKKLDMYNYRFAGMWVRLCAQVIDLSFLMLLGILTLKLVWAEFGLKNALEQSKIIIAFIFAAYTIILPASRLQSTLGMLIFRIKIIDLYGKRMSLFRSLARFVVLQAPSIILGSILVDLLGFNNYMATICVFIPFICIAFDQYKKGFHDYICGTYVIYAKDNL